MNEGSYGIELLTCENCGFRKTIESGFHGYREKIRREIVRKIRTYQWKDKEIGG